MGKTVVKIECGNCIHFWPSLGHCAVPGSCVEHAQFKVRSASHQTVWDWADETRPELLDNHPCGACGDGTTTPCMKDNAPPCKEVIQFEEYLHEMYRGFTGA